MVGLSATKPSTPSVSSMLIDVEGELYIQVEEKQDHFKGQMNSTTESMAISPNYGSNSYR